MVKSFSDEELSNLLEESFKKIQSRAESDSKKLSDMNNTLNWILTLTTFFFIFYYQQHSNLKNELGKYISIILRVIFVVSISVLIFHKFLLIKYEDFKGCFLSSLRTIYIDLKFNIDKIRPFIPSVDSNFTINFINNFRNGNLCYNSVKNITVRQFSALDKKINFYGKTIKLTYNFGMLLFLLNFLLIIYLIFQ